MDRNENYTKPLRLAELKNFISYKVEEILESRIWTEEKIRATSRKTDQSLEESKLFLEIIIKVLVNKRFAEEPQVLNLVSVLASSNFQTCLQRILLSVSTENDLSSVENIICFLRHLCGKSPSSAHDFFELATETEEKINRLIDARADDENDSLLDLQEEIESIKEIIKDNATKPKENREEQKKVARKPPNDFREISILPTLEDIYKQPFLRPNLRDSSFENLDDYLDVQFRLLREDCIAQLRSGILEYLGAKFLEKTEVRRLQDARLYKRVTIEAEKEMTLDGPMHTIKLDMNQVTRIRWERSNRLIFGSLLCISPNDFQTLYFGVIAESDNEVIKKNGTIKVLIKRQKGTPELRKGMFVTVVESVAYFEAYRHVLRCLQNIKGEMPFERYIVYCERDIQKPKYLRGKDFVKYDLQPIVSQSAIFQNQGRNVKCTISQRRRLAFQNQEKRLEIPILQKTRWPKANDLHLDKSQYEAFKSALTKEFVLIQGPPGTGKTHLGLRIAKALLHNAEHWRGVNESHRSVEVANDNKRKDTLHNKQEGTLHPMLIVCFTNHALDQFLEGLIDFMDPENRAEWKQMIVRVGSRSNSEKIEEFTLKNKRKLFRKSYTDYGKFEKELQRIHKQICALKWMISCAQENVLDEKVLSVYVDEVRMLTEAANQRNQGTQKPKRTFNILEWLNVNEKYFTEAAFEKYENIDKGQNNVDTEDSVQVEELIDIETEGDFAKNERMIEEDDFEMDYNFKEIGISVESVLLQLKSNPNFSDDFVKFLENEAAIAIHYLHKSKAMTEEEMRMKINDLWSLAIKDRWRMYKYFEKKFCEAQERQISELTAEYDAKYKHYLLEKNYVDKEILCSSLVIAMTTTGAARYQTVLDDIGAKIIIVEEAAEVLEAHIISTLSSHCEHLILIGDHKQLEPKPSVYELAEKYNLALSMFERMIENKLEFNCLLRQHRMRPEISDLVRDFYPGLHDNETVFNREHMLGIEKDVYFISHTHDEYQKGETQSYSNEFEARYIKRLTRYLLHQGYKRQEITVLTPYSGQMFCIRDLMPKNEFAGIRISILDNYQGEENNIILLSLVRSNKEGKIGFLKKENRICVALSRAKYGLYVIGNFKMIEKFTRRTHLLRSAIDKMKRSDSLGVGLPLYCQNHPGTQKINAKSPDDFDQAPEGGCSLPCNFDLECGHKCSHLCHPYDKEHLDIKCIRCCEKVCERGHTCPKNCHFPKPCRCRVKVEKLLECSHTAELPCFQEPDTYNCLKKVTKILDCGHDTNTHCWIPPESIDCKVIVIRKLPCGHSVDLNCHINYEEYDCQEIVKRTIPKCEHNVEMKCFENVNIFKCPTEVTEKRNDCDHNFTRPCHVSSMLFQVRNKCSEIVSKTFPSCGHSIDVKCSISLRNLNCETSVCTNFACHHNNIQVKCYLKDKEECKSQCGLICYMGHKCSRICHFPDQCMCEELVVKTLPLCGHLLKLKCSENVEKVKCQTKVLKSLKCGHSKKMDCYIDASQVKCKEKVVKILNCGHEKELPCHKDISDSDIKCGENVRKTLRCGHKLNMLCCEDPLGIKCTETVRKMLPCCHEQETECWREIADIQCKRMIEKTLPCGHTASAHCYRKPESIKCTENVIKPMTTCNHSMSMKCHASPRKIKCTQLVEITQPECNHVNSIACHSHQALQADSNSKRPQCTSNVITTEVCGHDVMNPCTERKKNVCRERCTFTLACGHNCSGDCHKCNGGLTHQTCAKKCKSYLVCGHSCMNKNCFNCKPCEKQCMAMCSHKTCKHVCSQPCVQCRAPCEWSCPHFTCDLLCYEPCERPRCNEKCPNVLVCGHKCAGICGEPCLQNCMECNTKAGKKISNKSRLVQLLSCGHIFTANELDAVLDSQEHDILRSLRCPTCQKAVVYHPRYNTILKKQAKLVNMMKTQVELAIKFGRISTFPSIFGDSKECETYAAEYGTFLSAIERKLERTDASNLKRSFHCLYVLKESLACDYPTYQSVVDIYRIMLIISYHWVLLVIKLARNDIVESLTNAETVDEMKSKQNDTICEKDVQSTVKIYDNEIGQIEQLLNFPGQFSSSTKNDIGKCIDSIKPLLTAQMARRIRKAEDFPKPIGIMDCHIDSWTMCENGHPFSAYEDHQTCFTCQKSKSMLKYPFAPQSTSSDEYEKQGARPKQHNSNRSSALANTDKDYAKQEKMKNEKSESSERFGRFENNSSIKTKAETEQEYGKRRNRIDRFAKQHIHSTMQTDDTNLYLESMIREITQSVPNPYADSQRRTGRHNRKRGKHKDQYANTRSQSLNWREAADEFQRESFSEQTTRGVRGRGRGRGNRGRGRQRRSDKRK